MPGPDLDVPESRDQRSGAIAAKVFSMRMERDPVILGGSCLAWIEAFEGHLVRMGISMRARIFIPHGPGNDRNAGLLAGGDEAVGQVGVVIGDKVEPEMNGLVRSEESGVGNGCVSTGSSRGWP